MPDDFDLTSMVNDPVFRRLWLLRKAMEGVPLDQAIELARRAEEFVGSSGLEPPSAQAKVVEAPEPTRQVIEPAMAGPGIEALPAEARTGLALSAKQRERLLQRLANGARNAELATEFGISPRQVQGVRMGSARDIAERRNALPNGMPLASDHSHEQARPNGTPTSGSDHSREQATPPNSNHPHEQPNGTPPNSDHSHEQLRPNGTPTSGSDHSREQATADDIVRYLRQQDDIVVPKDEGAFLVNGRFRLELPELVSRANKMRARQGKPEFRLASELSNQNRVRQATRHPIFWEQESGSDQAFAKAN